MQGWKRFLPSLKRAALVGAPKSVQLAQVEMFVHVFSSRIFMNGYLGVEMEKIGRFFLEKTEERMLSVEKETFGNQKTCTKR